MAKSVTDHYQGRLFVGRLFGMIESYLNSHYIVINHAKVTIGIWTRLCLYWYFSLLCLTSVVVLNATLPSIEDFSHFRST